MKTIYTKTSYMLTYFFHAHIRKYCLPINMSQLLHTFPSTCQKCHNKPHWSYSNEMLALYNCHLCTIDLIYRGKYRAICSFSPIQIIIVESNSLQFQNQVCWWHQSQLCSINHFHHTYLNPFSTVITKRWTINLHMSFRVANSYQAPVAN